MDGVEEGFGLALADIKNCVSSTSYHYLTAVLCLKDGSVCGSRSEGKNSQGTIGGRCSTNWSDSSGRISTISSGKSGGIRRDECGSSSRSRSASVLSASSSSDLRGSLIPEIENHLTVTVPFLDENEESSGKGHIVERHLNLSSLQKPVGITLPTHSPKHDDPLCSHVLPVCRKILAKTTPCPNRTTIGERRPRSISEIAEKGKSYLPRTDSPYEGIVGKIREIPLYKDRRTEEKADDDDGESRNLHNISSGSRWRNFKRSPTTAGVCDFSHPITNPLYKVYDPKGYVKSEDELAREYIEKIGLDFNGWLASLEGDPVQLDPQLLTKILRDELELPGPPRPN